MTYRTIKELFEAGAELVSQDSGCWNTWICKLPDGTFWKVHQPSDWCASVKVSQVERSVTELFNKWKDL